MMTFDRLLSFIYKKLTKIGGPGDGCTICIATNTTKTMKLWLDFETFSHLDVRDTGAWAYAKHWSTEPILAAYAVDDAKLQLWEVGQPLPPILADPKTIVWAHNAEFELAIWNFCLVPLGAAPLQPERVRCTAAQASAAGLPRALGKVAAFLQVWAQKDTDGKRLIKLFSMPQKDGRRCTKATHPEDWQKFRQYCLTDAESMRQCSKRLPDLPPYEQDIFLEHLKINIRGIGVDPDAVARLRQICLEAEAQYAKTEYGKVLNSPVQMRAMLSLFGVEVDDVGADTIRPLLDDGIGPEARKLITDRLGSSKTNVKKFKRAIAANAGDNRLCGMHVYYGAHTGRFSGALLQPHNMERDCLKTKLTLEDLETPVGQLMADLGIGSLDEGLALLDALPRDPAAAVAQLGGPDVALAFASAMIRPCLAATLPGRTLIARDFTAIEARVLAWLANAVKLLELYARREDPYRYMAERIFSIPYARIAKDSFERFVGKQTVLGAGFGMGWPRFIGHCADAGRLVEPDQAKAAITGYREGAPEVPSLWYEIDDKVDEVMEEHRGGAGRYVANGKLIFYKTEHNGIVTSLRCRLPSGRSLVWLYPAYVLTPGRDGEGKRQLTYLSHSGDSASVINVIARQCKEHKLDPRYYLGVMRGLAELDGWTRVTIWGGKFTENVVQAISRDILAEALIRLGRAGQPVVLHVHDEIVVEAPATAAPEVHRLMEARPAWAQDAQIEVEGWEGNRYRK